MDELQATLTAFGHGTAFVGRRLRFTVDEEELIVDLLLFHLTRLRYVVGAEGRRLPARVRRAAGHLRGDGRRPGP